MDDSNDAKLRDFLTKRGAKMHDMAAELNAAHSLVQAGDRPSVEKVLSIIDSLGIDAADKLKLRERIIQRAADSAAQATRSNIASDYEFYLFAAMAALVLVVFVFFGYKLYRSLTERERKRQEKLLSKQNKSKKK